MSKSILEVKDIKKTPACEIFYPHEKRRDQLPVSNVLILSPDFAASITAYSDGVSRMFPSRGNRTEFMLRVAYSLFQYSK
jgi:hypothetical protein